MGHCPLIASISMIFVFILSHNFLGKECNYMKQYLNIYMDNVAMYMKFHLGVFSYRRVIAL